MNIPVIDHLIVAGGTAELVSIREERPEILGIRKEAKYKNWPKMNNREMPDKNRERARESNRAQKAISPKKKEVSL